MLRARMWYNGAVSGDMRRALRCLIFGAEVSGEILSPGACARDCLHGSGSTGRHPAFGRRDATFGDDAEQTRAPEASLTQIPGTCFRHGKQEQPSGQTHVAQRCNFR